MQVYTKHLQPLTADRHLWNAAFPPVSCSFASPSLSGARWSTSRFWAGAPWAKEVGGVDHIAIWPPPFCHWLRMVRSHNPASQRYCTGPTPFRAALGQATLAPFNQASIPLAGPGQSEFTITSGAARRFRLVAPGI
jgi:hypothetical protein